MKFLFKFKKQFFSQNKNMIELCLNKAYKPDLINLEDISAGHGEAHDSHFQLYIVSDFFVNLKTLQRHRSIMKILKEEKIMDQIHALTIVAKTIDEHQKSNN